MFPALLTTVLFSISAVAAQRTTRMLGGVLANFCRIVLAAALLGLWAHTFGQGLSGKAFPFFLLSGLAGFGVGDAALYQTFPRLGSRLTILIVHCLAAPMAAISEWLWLGNRLSGLEILCALMILTGVALALAPSGHLHIPRRAFWVGIGFGLFAAAGQGIGAVLSRKAYEVGAQHGETIDGITAAYQRILAGVAVAFLFWLAAKRRDVPLSSRDAPVDAPAPRRGSLGAALPWIGINALAGPALGVSCYQWALSQAPTGVVLPIVALTPLVIIPFSRLNEGEQPTLRSLIGGVVAVAGVILLTKS